MLKGRGRTKGKRLTAHANNWYADEQTQERYEYIKRHYKYGSASQCMRELVNAEYKRVVEAERSETSN